MSNETDKATALLTGASSVIGKAIQRQLTADSYQLICISRSISTISRPATSKNNLSNSNTVWLSLNLSKKLQTQKEFATLKSNCLEAMQTTKKQKHSILVHSAPIWLLSKHISTLSELGIKRVIAFSSTSIDGKASSSSDKEQAVISRLKTAENDCKLLCKENNIHLTIFRPTMIYGDGEGENIGFIANFIKRFGFFPITSKAIGLRRPVHNSDLAQAVSLAAMEPSTYDKTYNLSGETVLAYQDMVKCIFETMGKKPKLIILPRWLYMRLIKIYATINRLLGKQLDIDSAMVDRMRQDLDFDYSPAKQDFNYSPKPFLPNGIQDLMK